MSTESEDTIMKCSCRELTTTNKNIFKQCFRDLWLFDDLLEAEQKLIDTICVCKQFIQGQSVFMQGDPANTMFLIKAGRIKLSKVLEDGTEVTLDFRKAGDILGENALSGEEDYPVSAWTMEDTIICGFSRNGFEQLIMQHPRIGVRIIQNMSKRMESLTSRLSNMTTGSLEDRLYRVLMIVAREHSRQNPKGLAIQFPLTHEELSFLVGAHRVSITKAMKMLVGSGKIIKEGRTLILPQGVL